jgi:ATP-dependent Clp protease ATP-binding subunit ClpA
VLRACGVDLDGLRREVLNYVDNELGNLVAAHGNDAKPTASFQRVLQRAAIHVQSSRREEVTGANVLVTLFAERESQAVYFLQEQDMTRFDAVNYISRGTAKAPGNSETRPVQGEATPDPGSVRVGLVAWIKASTDDGSATFQLDNYDPKSRSLITDPTLTISRLLRARVLPCCSIRSACGLSR